MSFNFNMLLLISSATAAEKLQHFISEDNMWNIYYATIKVN